MLPESDRTPLPQDRESLAALVGALRRERDHYKQQADVLHVETLRQTKRAEDLYLENLRLQRELEHLRRRYYGPRADRLESTSDLMQFLLVFAQQLDHKPIHPEDVPAPTEPSDELRRIKRRRGRRALANFEHLPVTTKSTS